MSFTELKRACSAGDAVLVERLLSMSGVDVNRTDAQRGSSALMFACHAGHAAVVQLLLAAPGIDVNHTNAGGLSALIMASEHGHDQVDRAVLPRAARGRRQ